MMSSSETHYKNNMTSVLPQLREIAKLVIHAASAETLPEVLERVANAARDLVGARYVALGVPNGLGGLRHFEFAGVTSEEVEAIGEPPQGHGLLGAIMRERQAIRVMQISADPRSSGFPANHPPMEHFLGVPIQVGPDLFGMFYMTDKIDGTPFNEADQSLVEIIAGYAALAIAGAQLRDRGRRVALLEERERISMELHDGVIQSLYAIGMYLEMLRMNDNARGDEIMPAIRDLDSVIEDIRRYIQNLKALSRPRMTLRDCLEEQLLRLHLPASLHVDLTVSEDDFSFSTVVIEAICLMVTEAVSNVIRHANATQLGIDARILGDEFHLQISDNGVGFDAEAVRPPTNDGGGLGLHNLRQRTTLHGGRLRIESQPEIGTRLTIILPRDR